MAVASPTLVIAKFAIQRPELLVTVRKETVSFGLREALHQITRIAIPINKSKTTASFLWLELATRVVLTH